MLPLDEAFHAVAAHHAPGPEERVPLLDARGRFLAHAIVARHDVPGFDNSAMDGYAVRAGDLATADGSPVSLPVEGESRAGGPPPGPLADGAVMRIFTGAPMPAGADAVVMQEDVAREGATARFGAAAPVGAHVRRRAEVLAIGDPVLTPEDALGPGELALAASQGYALLPVRRRPVVAILSTGDELREIGAPDRPGSLIDSNTYGLASAAAAAGATPWILPLGVDAPDALTARFEEAVHRADVVVSTGGVSVGDYDRVADALDAVGADTLFTKVRMKPGKPVRFAVAGRTPLFGLPGNPVSALVTFELFVRPLLRSRLGDPRPYRTTLDVALDRAVTAPASRDELARATLSRGPGPTARLADKQGSGATTSLRGADLLVRLPMGAGRLEAGTQARALHLVEDGGSRDAPFAR